MPTGQKRENSTRITQSQGKKSLSNMAELQSHLSIFRLPTAANTEHRQESINLRSLKMAVVQQPFTSGLRPRNFSPRRLCRPPSSTMGIWTTITVKFRYLSIVAERWSRSASTIVKFQEQAQLRQRTVRIGRSTISQRPCLRALS